MHFKSLENKLLVYFATNNSEHGSIVWVEWYSVQRLMISVEFICDMRTKENWSQSYHERMYIMVVFSRGILWISCHISTIVSARGWTSDRPSDSVGGLPPSRSLSVHMFASVSFPLCPSVFLYMSTVVVLLPDQWTLPWVPHKSSE